MNNQILNILLATILFGCAPEKQRTTECINFDKLELLNEKFLHNNSEFNGCARKIYGKYTVELQFVNGKKNGYVQQFKDSILIEEGTFKDNKLEGEFKTYNPDGSINSTISYKNGLKDGEERIYWETGELGHLYNYSKDQLVDTSYSYYKSGDKLARSVHLEGFGNSEEINYLDSTRTNFMSGSMRNGKSVNDWIYKFSSDSCFIRHYASDDSYTQTLCDCDTLAIPNI